VKGVCHESNTKLRERVIMKNADHVDLCASHTLIFVIGKNIDDLPGAQTASSRATIKKQS